MIFIHWSIYEIGYCIGRCDKTSANSFASTDTQVKKESKEIPLDLQGMAILAYLSDDTPPAHSLSLFLSLLAVLRVSVTNQIIIINASKCWSFWNLPFLVLLNQTLLPSKVVLRLSLSLFLVLPPDAI